MARRKIYTPRPSNTLDQADQIRVAAGYQPYKVQAAAALKRARRAAKRG